MNEEKNEQKNEEKKKQYWLLIALAGLILAFVIGSIILQQCLDGSLLEYYGSVLTMTGTLILGAVTFWQTKRSLEIAEESQKTAERSLELAEKGNAREEEAEDEKHRLKLSVKKVAYSTAEKEDLGSAPVLRLKEYKRQWRLSDERANNDLYFDKKDGSERKLRTDLLFLEVYNDSDDDVKVEIDHVIKQYYPDGKEFEPQEVSFDGMTLRSGDTDHLVIRSAGKSDKGYTGPWEEPWKLELRLNITKGDETVSQDVKVSYWIIEPKQSPQKYAIAAVIPDRIVGKKHTAA